MLVLTRKLQERIKIGDNVTITVLRVKGNAVRIGIEAPRNVRVVRAELSAEGSDTAAPDESPAADNLSGTAENVANETHVTSGESESSPTASPLRFPQRRLVNRCGAPPLRVARSQVLATSGALS